MKPKLRISSVQERAAVITSEMMGDATAKRVTISSDEPYLREDEDGELYYEVLGHGPGEIDDSRLRLGLPILWNHKDDIHLGRSTKYTNNGKAVDVGTLDDLIWTEGEFSLNKKRDVEKGALVGTSVGYNVGRGEQIAMKDGVPVIKFQWKPYEFSWCPVEADVKCGAGRSVSHEAGEPEILEIPVINHGETGKKIDGEPVNQQKAQSDMNPTASSAPRVFRNKDESGGGTATATRTAEEIAAEKQRITELAKAEAKEMRKRDAERQKQIKETGQDFGIEEAVITRFVEDEDMSHEHFMREVQKIQRERSKGTQVSVTHESSPSTHRDGGSTSRSRQSDEGGSPGAQLTRAQQFVDFARGGGKGEVRLTLKHSYLSARMAAATQLQRAGFNSADLAGINLTISQNMIPIGVQRLTIQDLIAPGSMDTEGFLYPVENSFDDTAAAEVAERDLKPEWEPDIDTDRADAKVIAVMATIPKQFVADFSAFRSYLDNRLAYLLNIRLERQVLYGNGLGANILGIVNRPGRLTRAYGAVASETSADALFRGNTDIEVGSNYDVDGFAMHPYDYEQIRLLKDSTGQYLGGGPFYAPYGNSGVIVKFMTLWGLPCVVTKSVTQGKPIAGAWRMGAQLFMRSGITIEVSNSHKDYFQRNLLAVLAEERAALAVYHPGAFIEHTNFPGRS